MRIVLILLALVAILGHESPSGTTTASLTSVSDNEIWHLTLPEPIRAGLDSTEEVRCIVIGAQKIPLGGFEPIETAVESPRLPKISRPRSPENPEPLEPWNLGLRDAIRISLDNSEVVRTVAVSNKVWDCPPIVLCNCFGGSDKFETFVWPQPPVGFDLTIARVNRKGSIWTFQADVMAHVRSVEMQYWSLWLEQATVDARAAAVQQAEEILGRERAKREVDPIAVAEVERQLESFKLALVSDTSDAITIERNLRNMLGLPLADDRRIIAITPPQQAKIEPEWESCVREMNASEPAIAQQKVVTRLSELQLVVARNQLLPALGPETIRQFEGLGDALPATVDLSAILGRAVPTPAASVSPTQAGPYQSGGTFSMPIDSRLPRTNTRQAQYQLLREQSALERITHESTHSLARTFLEVDANFKQYTTARRLKVAAQERLEAQQVFSQQGRIPIDRLLDAISQQADAIVQEALYLATYNTSLAALEEAKGTLLACKGIAVAEEPATTKALLPAKDDRVAAVAIEAPAAAVVAPWNLQGASVPTTSQDRARFGGLKALEVEVNPTAPPR